LVQKIIGCLRLASEDVKQLGGPRSIWARSSITASSAACGAFWPSNSLVDPKTSENHRKLWHRDHSLTIFIYSLSSRSSAIVGKMKKARIRARMKELQATLKGMKQSDPRMKELQVENCA